MQLDARSSNSRNTLKNTVLINKALGARTERVLVTAPGGCPGQSSFYLKTFSTAAVPLEVEISQRLNHPGFVRVLAYMAGEGCSQVLSADAGASCCSRRYKYGPSTTPFDMFWGMNKVLCSMVHAEALGVVHRDLKADNIVGNWNIRELSSAVDVSHFRQHVQHRLVDGAVGTPGYMAPEMARFMEQGGSLEQLVAITTSKLDVYSYGVVFYELLTGCLPPAAGRGPLTYPEHLAVWPHLREVQALIASCLQADPHQRPSFAQLQRQASTWLAPLLKEAARALVTRAHMIEADHMIRWDQSMSKVFSGKEVQQELRPWHRRARRASKPLSSLQRLHLGIKHKLSGLGNRQQREAERSTAAQPAEVVVVVGPAQPSTAAQAAPAPASPAAPAVPAAGPTVISCSSGAVDCVVVVTCVAASSHPAKGKANSKVAGWAISMQHRLAASLQRIDVFCTQLNPMRRLLGKPVPVAAF